MLYVDDCKIRLGRMLMSHLTADDVEELHAAGEAVGLRRAWFQEPPRHRHAHYDVAQVKGRGVIEHHGAQAVSRRELARRARALAEAMGAGS